MSDLDIHIAGFGSSKRDLGRMEIELNPRVRYFSNQETGTLDAAVFIKAEIVLPKIAFNIYAGAGVNHNFNTDETVPYATQGIQFGVDMDSWAFNKKKDKNKKK